MAERADNILQTAVKEGATDIFIVAGHAVTMRLHGRISADGNLTENALNATDCEDLIREI